ncbi:MAG TPA: beta/gamma crystallin-related protein [Rhizomicrobium sp.]|jgi:hypothetical protein|nr:beta/gamma crystallin-related protein [Rhizomicrobium sp.]
MKLSATILAAVAAASLAATPVLARPKITLYSAPNYQGHAVDIDRPVRDLSRYGFNDRAQSARVRGRWLVCAADDFGGKCVTLNYDSPRLKDFDMNRRASSLRPD